MNERKKERKKEKEREEKRKCVGCRIPTLEITYKVGSRGVDSLQAGGPTKV